MALPVADAALIVAGIARDMVERAARRDVAAFLADDERKLAFIVEIVAHLRLHHRLEVADLTAGEAGEQRRLLGDGAAGLGDMVAVVEADADDLAGIGDDGCKGDLVERDDRARSDDSQLGGIGERGRFRAAGAASCSRSCCCAEIDDAVVLDGAEGGASVGDE